MKHEGPADTPTPRRMDRLKRRRRRARIRWVANGLILCGVLLLAYPVSTWTYTWFAQRDLARQLDQTEPGVAAAEAALQTPSAAPTTSVATSLAPSGDVAQAGGSIPPATGQQAGGASAGAGGYDTFRAAAQHFAATVSFKAGTPLGRIIIPSIGLNVVMIEGTGKGDLREGPGHWPETPFPGLGGNFVVSGHRTTYGAPFFKLNKVKVGDEIDLALPYAAVRYVVTRVVVVAPDAVKSVAQAGKEQISLAACHPIYSASKRIVVQGDLAGFEVMGE